MGCPDWPKCFGRLIPPINESQLPADYQDQFLEKRLKKAERFIKLLDNLGFHTLSERVKNDRELKVTHAYSRSTAYIEWINRLFGVLTGIFSLLAVISGASLKNPERKRFYWVLFGTFWVIFNGWLGSIVVDTNLIRGIVSTHYLAAYLAMGSFILALSKPNISPLNKNQTSILTISLALLFIELFLGTTTREIIDHLRQRDGYILNSATVWVPGTIFLIHRILGVLILLSNLYLLKLVKNNPSLKYFRKMQIAVLTLITVQIASGFINVFYDIPPAINIIHITVSAAIIGIQLRMKSTSKLLRLN